MKPTIVFPFVEAGLGHIMPMSAVSTEFEKKYGDKCNIVKTSFFKDTDNEDLKYLNEELIREVKKHNKNRIHGFMQFLLMSIFGSRMSLKYLMETHYKRALKPSLEYMESLKPDLVFNTHFSTLYYSCKLVQEGKLDTKVVSYCPDPHIGRQWDRRCDNIFVSSVHGKDDALKDGFKNEQLGVVPFLIRKEIETYDKGKAFYRNEIGAPEDNFTVLLADGAYGAGKLRDTVIELLKSKHKMTIIAVCGRNEALYQEFLTFDVPENICFKPYGFTDKMLTLSACCDLFIGKAGASNLAEPCYFGAPQIINFCATPIEDWIAAYYLKELKSAIFISKPKKIAAKVEEWMDDPSLMKVYSDATAPGKDVSGAVQLADQLWEILQEQMAKKVQKDEQADAQV